MLALSMTWTWIEGPIEHKWNERDHNRSFHLFMHLLLAF